jgi:hypothetical protein
MARKTARAAPSASDGPRSNGARRLIAGLRVNQQDEALLAVVRPYLSDASSEGDVAYRLWRRGLEVTLAEVASMGVALPPGSSEELIASLVAQRLLLCLPLLRRTGRLALLGFEGAVSTALSSPMGGEPLATTTAEVDESAADAVAGLGGNDFL